ncbi:hypothetical protein O7626_16560 [Micromonospora sp. WMMD1102]|uniref:hypothetical protein n=1 Tax=Micromonospora sp. WMMD1102 TaxID=3016105 RepID=UPI00241500CB|nr:hypothetical protein [Micromonospora sp. WMMD1102]MDG4787527.1 hypothetical protein [Micromonospora sp. WMMD1102]
MSPVRALRSIGGTIPEKRRTPPNRIADRVFEGLPRDGVPASPEPPAPAPRYVIQLSATSADLAGAVDLAYALARSLGFLPQIDAAEAMVCAADTPHVRHRVCCGRPLPTGGPRCLLRADHDDPCAPDPTA